MTVPRVSTEQALASVANLRADLAAAADRDELKYRVRTAVKYAEALLCECVRRPTGPVLLLCDRCQLLGILTPGTTP